MARHDKEQLVTAAFCWTQKGIDHYQVKLANAFERFPAVAAEPISSELLVEIVASGDTPRNLIKQGFATGTPPSAPKHLLDAQDGWQAGLAWPLCTDDERPLLEELQAAVAPLLEGRACADWPDTTGPVRLLRFLRGFEYDVPVAAVAVRRMLELRDEYAMDEPSARSKACAALESAGPAGPLLPIEKSADIHASLPYLRMGVANEAFSPGIGPVHYVSLAKQDHDGFFAAGCEAAWAEHHTLCQAACIRELHDLSEERQAMVKTCLVIDFADSGLSNLRHKQFDKVIKERMDKIDRSNAEVMGVMFLLNLPRGLTMLFSIMMRLLPARTLAKIQNVPRGKEAASLLPVIGAAAWKRICEHRAASEAGADGTSFSVAAGKTYTRTLLLPAHTRVRWTFAAEKHDIDFSVRLYGTSATGEVNELASAVEKRRISASEGVVNGEFIVPAAAKVSSALGSKLASARVSDTEPDSGFSISGDLSVPAAAAGASVEPATEMLVELVWSNLHSYMRSKTVMAVAVEVDEP